MCSDTHTGTYKRIYKTESRAVLPVGVTWGTQSRSHTMPAEPKSWRDAGAGFESVPNDSNMKPSYSF